MYEYQTQRIESPKWFLSEKALLQADQKRQQIIDEQAKNGWWLVQIIQPFGAESLLRCYYELIFERPVEGS